jgi:hypothetical protein
MEYLPLAFVLFVMFLGVCIAVIVLDIKGPPQMVDQPKARVKEWHEEMMDRVWHGAMVANFSWDVDQNGYQITMSAESNLSNLRRYMCDFMTALERLDNEKSNAGAYDIDSDLDHFQFYNVVKARREFIEGVEHQIRTMKIKIQTAIDLELDKQFSRNTDNQQLALDF